MATPSLLTRSLLVAAAATTLLLSGCGAATPDPTPTDIAGGGSGDTESTEGGAGGDTGDSGLSGLEQAAADGMPDLGITECAQLDSYDFSENSGRSFWEFSYTCTSRDAFDATTASLIAAGYDASPLVIGDETNVSERNHFQADANGGSTEVQLNIVGSPDELEYEIYVTIDLP